MATSQEEERAGKRPRLQHAGPTNIVALPKPLENPLPPALLGASIAEGPPAAPQPMWVQPPPPHPAAALTLCQQPDVGCQQFDHGSQQSEISCLPDEMLAKVISHVPFAERRLVIPLVCTQWASVARGGQPEVWTSWELNDHEEYDAAHLAAGGGGGGAGGGARGGGGAGARVRRVQRLPGAGARALAWLGARNRSQHMTSLQLHLPFLGGCDGVWLASLLVLLPSRQLQRLRVHSARPPPPLLLAWLPWLKALTCLELDTRLPPHALPQLQQLSLLEDLQDLSLTVEGCLLALPCFVSGLSSLCRLSLTALCSSKEAKSLVRSSLSFGLPSWLPHACPRLQSLLLHGVLLRRLPVELASLPALERLSCTGSPLPGGFELPGGALSALRALRELAVDSAAGALPPEAGDLSSLTRLDLSRSRSAISAAVDAGVGAGTAIAALGGIGGSGAAAAAAACGGLTQLPEELSRLAPSLKVLALQWNQRLGMVQEGEEDEQRWCKQQQGDVQGGSQEEEAACEGSGANMGRQRSRQQRQGQGLALTAAAAAGMCMSRARRPPLQIVATLTGLQELNLTACNVAAIPPEFSRLVSLRRLLLGSNVLRELPDGVFRLPSLQVLDCSNNTSLEVDYKVLRLLQLPALKAGKQCVVDFSMMRNARAWSLSAFEALYRLHLEAAALEPSSAAASSPAGGSDGGTLLPSGSTTHLALARSTLGTALELDPGHGRAAAACANTSSGSHGGASSGGGGGGNVSLGAGSSIAGGGGGGGGGLTVVWLRPEGDLEVVDELSGRVHYYDVGAHPRLGTAQDMTAFLQRVASEVLRPPRDNSNTNLAGAEQRLADQNNNGCNSAPGGNGGVRRAHGIIRGGGASSSDGCDGSLGGGSSEGQCASVCNSPQAGPPGVECDNAGDGGGEGPSGMGSGTQP